SRSRFVRDLVLTPGLNSLELDLPVGTLELEGLPLPAVFDFLGSAEISVSIILTWEGNRPRYRDAWPERFDSKT
ncbi:MAG: hypothetical protein V3R27_03990, partial [Pseudomonadales bacterium]